MQHRWILEGLCINANRGSGNIVLSAFLWNKSDKEEEALPRLAMADEVDPITDISMDTDRWFNIVQPFLSNSLTENICQQGA